MSQTLFYTLFFSFIVGMIVLGFSYLPLASEYPLPTEIATSFELIVGYMKMFDFIFPFNTLFTIVSLGVALEIVVFLWYRLVWILGVIRGVGSTGV